MATVDVNTMAAYSDKLEAQADWLRPKVGGGWALVSTNKPGDFLQWLCYNDGTINNYVSIIISYYYYRLKQECKVGSASRPNFTALTSFSDS